MENSNGSPRCSLWDGKEAALRGGEGRGMTPSSESLQRKRVTACGRALEASDLLPKMGPSAQASSSLPLGR